MPPPRPSPRDARPGPSGGSAPTRKILFLDDDPARAEVFLKGHPEAVWVQTAADCIARLAERWDEVHLDHDLGGEHFVDHNREDCGMEVVRWICMGSRPHLKNTRFLIHSHNIQAATMMGLQMLANGFKVDVRPFGTAPADAPSETLGDEPDPILGPIKAFVNAVLRFFGRRTREHSYGYNEYGRGPGDAQGSTPVLDLTWARPADTPRPAPRRPADPPERPATPPGTDPPPPPA